MLFLFSFIGDFMYLFSGLQVVFFVITKDVSYKSKHVNWDRQSQCEGQYEELSLN